jgi:hypothetical protein
MTGRIRVGTALVAGLLGFVAQASAQIPGMPLFTNPRYGTGIRVHADIGQPTEAGTSVGDVTVVQGGVTFALGPVGIGANVGTSLRRAKALAAGDTLDYTDNFTGSAIAQLRLLGGGVNPLSVSVFGGASADITAIEVVAQSANVKLPRFMNFPVGAAAGFHLPLGPLNLNLWGAGRLVFSKYVNCPSTDPVVDGHPITGLSTLCDTTDKNFRWAVGADLPILGILSLRAAYDSGKVGSGAAKQTVSVWGVGASIGLGGMR